jgi:multiple antibiotic resistance protein
MIVFLYVGKPLLKVLNLDVHSFAVGGSIVMFLVGLEMVLGLDILKKSRDQPERLFLLHSR